MKKFLLSSSGIILTVKKLHLATTRNKKYVKKNSHNTNASHKRGIEKQYLDMRKEMDILVNKIDKLNINKIEEYTV